MSIRLDPRRLAALKLLAAEAGIRPGELVTRWVEERLDAARAGGAAPSPAAAAPGVLADLRARLEDVERRLDDLSSARAVTSADAGKASPVPADDGTSAAVAPAPKRRGRPPKNATAATATRKTTSARARVPLHEEIAAVIGERGPLSAADLATAILERGRYAPPRSSKPLDAATVNSRVSNPAYRSRFIRRDGRIDLAPAG
jgi:hypothetical protein